MHTFVNCNLVLVATNLNPSIFSQIWLVKRGIFAEDEFEPESLFTPSAVNVITKHSVLLVVPERLQLTLNAREGQYEIINRIIGKIVEALPHTPFNAVGFNYEWIVEPTHQTKFSEDIRDFFLAEKNPLINFFDAQNARFGIYMSKDELGMRFKVNAKPIAGFNKEKGEQEALNFQINFHKDYNDPEKAVEEILQTLENWEAAKGISEKIIMEFDGAWSSL